MGVDVGLLGSIEGRVDGVRVELRGEQQRRLLAYLALTPGVARGVDGIVDALWPGDDVPVEPRQAVHTYVSRLRSVFGSASVVGRDGGYALDVARSAVDVGRFEALVREAADPGCALERVVGLLSEALSLWRGPALEGFESEAWARGDAARLEEMRCAALDDRAEAQLQLGRAADAVADLEAAAAASPLRERTHRLLMSALSRSGRQAEALRTFQRYRRRLATDLGLEPGVEILQLEASILAASSDDSSVDSGRRLRGYVLGERVGEGAFAVVYRGTQPVVGRDVAIKVVRAELANRPEFIRRFETEAHLVARLEHPYIVPLYDYWREPGSAYLVMRLLRGGTLEQHVLDRRLGAEDAARMATQVGAALGVAHRAGVVHRDVKPANIFLDGEGNYYLGDFGIAFEAAAPPQAADSLSVGSPAYASPEQLRRERVGPPADVHGLGISLFEALTGDLPFPGARTQAELLRRQLTDPLPSVRQARPDLGPSVDVVLSKATAKDPADRYATVDEFVTEFCRAVSGLAPATRTGTATVIGELRNPYKGLRAFQEADALDFHGRRRLVDRLVERLAGSSPDARFLTVVGPSGSGKSSLVRAGLLPALRAGEVAGSDDWFVTSMVPGAHPFEELEAALNRIAVTPTTGLADLMVSDRRGIARALKQACPVENFEVVVLIDQFEELFTLCPDEQVRQAFIGGLVAAVLDPRSRLRVVATLRADFFDRPLRYPELAPLIESGAVTVSPLAADELDRAITEPAARVGAAFEPGLVARIVADVVDQPGALPLLQYALTELFDRNISGLMTTDAYESLGGLSGALARRAQQLYADADAETQEATRRVFSRLVTLGEGTEDTRRRVKRSEFGADPVTSAVIDTYGAARLLAFDRDPATREPTVEVAHEALIREWPTLRAWVDDSRDGLRLHRHLTTAATAWEASGRESGELYRGGRLEAAEQWARTNAGEMNPSESEFVSASIEQRDAAVADEQRAKRRLQRALTAVAVVAIVAVVAGGVAWRQQRTALDAKQSAQTAAFRAETGRLAASAPIVAQSNLAVGWLVAAESYGRDQNPETLGSLQRSLLASERMLGFVGSGNDYRSVALDAGTIYGLRRGAIDRWDIETRAPLAGLALPDRELDSAYYENAPIVLSVAGGVATVVFADRSAVAVDTTTGAATDLGAVHRALPSPDGRQLLIIDAERRVRLVDYPSLQGVWATEAFPEITVGDELNLIGGGDPAVRNVFQRGSELRGDALFTPGGDVIVSWGSRLFRYELATGAVLARGGGIVEGNGAGPAGSGTDYWSSGWLALDDAGRLASGNLYWASTWDPDTLAPVSARSVRFGSIPTELNAGMGVAPGDRRVIVHGSGLVDEIDAGSTPDQRTWRFDAQVGAIHAVATDPDHRRAVVAGADGIGIVAVDGGRLLARAVTRAPNQNLVFSALDGETVTVVTSSGPEFPGVDVLWRCAGEAPCKAAEAGAAALEEGPFDFVRLGRRHAATQVIRITQCPDPTCSAASVLKVRSLDGLRGLPDLPIGVVTSDDAQWPVEAGWVAAIILVAVNADGSSDMALRVWRAADGSIQRDVPLGDDATSFVTASAPDGSSLFLLDPSTGNSLSFDTTTWEQVPSPLPAGAAFHGVFNGDGSRFASVDALGVITIRDGKTFEAITTLAGGRLNGGAMVFSADGRYLLSSTDGAVRLWDIEAGETVGGPFVNDSETKVFIDAADTVLATGVGDHALIWNVQPDTWIAEACRAAGRNLTREEWEQFGPRDTEYHATCPQWPSGA